jgi:hypothetical protein
MAVNARAYPGRKSITHSNTAAYVQHSAAARSAGRPRVPSTIKLIQAVYLCRKATNSLWGLLFCTIFHKSGGAATGLHLNNNANAEPKASAAGELKPLVMAHTHTHPHRATRHYS